MSKRSLAVFLVTAMVAAQCMLAQSATPASASQPANAAHDSVDLPPGPMQQKAVTACTECHETRIIVQQRLSKAAWTKEMDKMVKWGALVDPKDRDGLIDYFSTNFGTDKPAYVPERSAPVSSPAKK